MDDCCTEDQSQATYQRYELHTGADGSISGTTETNDNEDRGYPSEYARWAVTFRNYDDMKRITGLSHIGCIGCVVTVHLDGKKV